MPAARPLEPILWAGAMFAAVLLGISLRFLAFLVILPWSVLVWPLHRQRARASMAWPPPYALEVWQTALGASLVALATFVAAWVTDHTLRARGIPGGRALGHRGGHDDLPWRGGEPGRWSAGAGLRWLRNPARRPGNAASGVDETAKYRDTNRSLPQKHREAHEL